jgi:hypothetical protein
MPLQMKAAAPMHGSSAFETGKSRPLPQRKYRDCDQHQRDTPRDLLRQGVTQQWKVLDRDDAADQEFPGPRQAHEECIGGAVRAHQPDAQRERCQRHRAKRNRQRDPPAARKAQQRPQQ